MREDLSGVVADLYARLSDLERYGVPRVASAAALSTDPRLVPVQPGMVAYVDSNDVAEGIYTYNGASWRPGSWNMPLGEPVAAANVTANQSGITTIVDLTGFTLTWTNPGNRKYAYVVTIPDIFGSVVGTGTLTIADGSNTVLQTYSPNILSSRSAFMFDWRENIAAAGSVTRKIRLTAGGAASITITMSATQAGQFSVRDVGPSGVPL